jgi:hypothetical protein
MKVKLGESVMNIEGKFLIGSQNPTCVECAKLRGKFDTWKVTKRSFCHLNDCLYALSNRPKSGFSRIAESRDGIYRITIEVCKLKLSSPIERIKGGLLSQNR